MTDTPSPVFGVITRVYGTREQPTHQFLWDAFSSLLAQRWWYWHHVIVDDFSTDNSAKIIAEYAARWDVADKCTVIRNQRNLGPAASFNVAVAALPDSCTWLCCLDADDMIDARYLSEAAEAINADPRVNVVTAPCRHFGTVHTVHKFPRFRPERMLDNCHIPGQALYQRALFTALGGYDPTMRSAEDWDFFIRAQISVGLTVHALSAPRWYYRVHDGLRMSRFAMTWEGQELLRAYWRGHRKDNLGQRTWGAWLAQEQPGRAA